MEFNIEVIFPVPSQFEDSEREKILRAAKRWEEQIVRGMPDYVIQSSQSFHFPPFPDTDDAPTQIQISEGEVIDDLRVYVVTAETSYDPWWGYTNADVLHLIYNPQTNLPVVARIAYMPSHLWWEPEGNENRERTEGLYLPSAIHEFGHTLGIGVGPQWDQYITPGLKKYSRMQQTDLSKYGGNFFTGPEAIAAMKEMPRLLGRAIEGNRFYERMKSFWPDASEHVSSIYRDGDKIISFYTYPGGEYYIGSGVPITHDNFHWENMLWDEYMIGRRSWSYDNILSLSVALVHESSVFLVFIG